MSSDPMPATTVTLTPIRTGGARPKRPRHLRTATVTLRDGAVQVWGGDAERPWATMTVVGPPPPPATSRAPGSIRPADGAPDGVTVAWEMGGGRLVLAAFTWSPIDAGLQAALAAEAAAAAARRPRRVAVVVNPHGGKGAGGLGGAGGRRPTCVRQGGRLRCLRGFGASLRPWAPRWRC